MKFIASEPKSPGTFLYKEGNNNVVAVKVFYHKDLQSGISESLVAQPIPPRWENLPVPVWDVSDLTGVFYDLEPDETLEDKESPQPPCGGQTPPQHNRGNTMNEVPCFSTAHPETGAFEVFLGNFTSEDAKEIGWKTKRPGVKSYCVDGSDYPFQTEHGVLPYFADQREISEAGLWPPH